MIDKGAFDAFKKMDGDEAPGKKVKSYTMGGSFGELALMYNQRRAAVRAEHREGRYGREGGGRWRGKGRQYNPHTSASDPTRATPRPSSQSVIASEDSVVWAVTQDVFKQLILTSSMQNKQSYD